MLDDGTVRAVDRAISILIEMGERKNGIGVTELARSLGLHKSTASRLLATLQHRGLVCQDKESSRYRLGPAMVRLGCNAERALDIGQIAVNDVAALGRVTGENVALEVAAGEVMIRVAYSDATGRGRLYGGRNFPLHATAGGKVLLAHRPERDVIRLSRSGFTAYTNTTIVQLEALFRELALIRKRGYASAFGELDLRINSLAVPVFDQRCSAVAALEIHGPALRITASRLPELLSRAGDCAAHIMTRIGGVIPCTCDSCTSRSSNTVVDWARHAALVRKQPDDGDGEAPEPARWRQLRDTVVVGPATDPDLELAPAH